MTHPTFDQFADAYEAMIDWPKRLANEQALFRRLFDRIGAKSILDVACGTGHHANLFHTWGLNVEAADASQAMIARCRQQWGESETLKWRLRDFDQPVEPPGRFDVAVCIGNSLALAKDPTTAAAAVVQMLRAVRSGGGIVVHVVNLWGLADGQGVWQKCLRASLRQGQSLIIKGIRRSGSRGQVELLVANLEADPPALSTHSTPFLGLEMQELASMARAAGASAVEFFGDYQQRGYDPAASADLVMLAMK